LLLVGVIREVIGLMGPWSDGGKLARRTDEIGKREALGNQKAADDWTAVAADLHVNALARCHLDENGIGRRPGAIVLVFDMTIDRDRTGSYPFERKLAVLIRLGVVTDPTTERFIGHPGADRLPRRRMAADPENPFDPTPWQDCDISRGGKFSRGSYGESRIM